VQRAGYGVGQPRRQLDSTEREDGGHGDVNSHGRLLSTRRCLQGRRRERRGASDLLQPTRSADSHVHTWRVVHEWLVRWLRQARGRNEVIVDFARGGPL
jgi:hypothetical protein